MDAYEFNIAEMKERITLQEETQTSDGMSGFTSAWSDEVTIWAKAWTVSSSEGTNGKQVSMERIQKFKIRYRSALNPAWRVKWGTSYFNIVGIDPDQEKEFLYLTCKEAV